MQGPKSTKTGFAMFYEKGNVFYIFVNDTQNQGLKWAGMIWNGIRAPSINK